MILQLDPDLPLSRLVPDEWILQKLLSWWSVHVVLDETSVNEFNKFF